MLENYSPYPHLLIDSAFKSIGLKLIKSNANPGENIESFDIPFPRMFILLFLGKINRGKALCFIPSEYPMTKC